MTVMSPDIPSVIDLEPYRKRIRARVADKDVRNAALILLHAIGRLPGSVAVSGRSTPVAAAGERNMSSLDAFLDGTRE